MQIYKILAKSDIPTLQQIIKRYKFTPNKSNNKNKTIKNHKDNISDNDIKKLMQHDSYKRSNGCIRQTRWS